MTAAAVLAEAHTVFYKQQAITLVGHAHDHITRIWRNTGKFYEHQLLEAIHAYDLPGVYADVGAHVGNHAVFFATMCRATQVIACEASARNLQLLSRNVVAQSTSATLRGAITVVPQPMGTGLDTVEVCELSTTNTGMDCVLQSQKATARHTWALDNTLSEVVQGQDRVAVLKIDVEGFEMPVLHGARLTIEADRPLIVIEAATPRAHIAQSEWLLARDYKIVGQYNATPTFIWEPR